MARRRGSDFDWRAAAGDVTFTPGAHDVGPLLDLLATDEEATHVAVERSLGRVGAGAARVALERLPGTRPPLRARLAHLVGKIAAATGDAALGDALAALTADEDPKTRRNAILALGKLARPSEPLLLDLFRREERIDHRRSIAASLGKVGGPASLALLASIATDDAELTRIIAEALTRLRRNVTATDESTVDDQATPARPIAIRLHCRRGLETLLAREIDGSPDGAGRVTRMLSGPLAQLWRARTMTHFGFPIAPVAVASDADRPAAVAAALASDEARAVIAAFSRGAPRYRIEWSGGKRRAAVHRAVEEIAARWPELVNDPSRRGWEIVVHDAPATVAVELQPRLADPRFRYRVTDVPAASHPTLAAALALVAGPRTDEVAWDPFVGSGSELVERALLSPYARLLGSDVDPRALAAARANFAAAKLDVQLTHADAISHSPTGVTLIISNPPMGRRVHRRSDLGDLLDHFVDHAARVLQPRGRLVWISPFATRTATRASRAGLTLTTQLTVDLGGFDATLQRFDKR